MDIHRCRFIPYPASSINALGFSHQLSRNDPAPKCLRLALGRANGDIEIWNPQNGSWVQELILKGGKGRCIEGLVWTHDLEGEGPDNHICAGKLRLFTIGYSSAVTEWNLSTGLPLRHSSANHGEIWCIAAQQRWNKGTDSQVTRSNQLIAAGCADGSIVLHSTEDENLEYARTLPRPSKSKSRILSLTFYKRHTLIAGCSNGTIWIYDIRGQGRIKRTMSLGANSRGALKDILVWSVKIARDNVLVSGDSSGQLRFWDLKTATQLQTVVCHDADIHDIAPSAEGMALMSGGADGKLCKLQYNSNTQRWSRASHQKIHSSDIKAIAALETKTMSVVFSGGGDSIPIVTPFRLFGAENHLSLSALPSLPPIASIPHDRILASWWDREINLCKVSTDLFEINDIELTPNGEPNAGVFAKILIQGEEAITSAALSACGTNRLAVATSLGCKVFTLKPRRITAATRSNSSRTQYKIRKMDAPGSLTMCGARHVQFSPDGKWLFINSMDNRLLLYRFTSGTESRLRSWIVESPIELYRREHPQDSVSRPQQGVLDDYEKVLCRIAWSSDSRMLAAADLSGYIDAWVLRGDETDVLSTNDTHETLNNGTKRLDNIDSDPESEWDPPSRGQSIDESSRKILGQSWSRLQATLPKLSTFPVVLSFRPFGFYNAGFAASSNKLSKDRTLRRSVTTEDRLIAITSMHEFYEFRVIEGQLSDWSRKNPTSHFPAEFLKQKDRLKGCVWNLQSGKERLWVFSSTALWMFDLGKDLAQPNDQRKQMSVPPKNVPNVPTTNQRKRKRDDKKAAQWPHPQGSSGAGDRIQKSEARHGATDNTNTITTEEVVAGKHLQKMEIDGTDQFNGLSDTDEDHEARTEEKLLTNGNLSNGVLTNGIFHDEDSAADDDDDNDNSGVFEKQSERGLVKGSREDIIEGTNSEHGVDKEKSKEKYWRTYKYRPILGIVPLQKSPDGSLADDEHDEAPPDIEVALIERPLWETNLDLPWQSHP